MTDTDRFIIPTGEATEAIHRVNRILVSIAAAIIVEDEDATPAIDNADDVTFRESIMSGQVDVLVKSLAMINGDESTEGITGWFGAIRMLVDHINATNEDGTGRQWELEKPYVRLPNGIGGWQFVTTLHRNEDGPFPDMTVTVLLDDIALANTIRMDVDPDVTPYHVAEADLMIEAKNDAERNMQSLQQAYAKMVTP